MESEQLKVEQVLSQNIQDAQLLELYLNESYSRYLLQNRSGEKRNKQITQEVSIQKEKPQMMRPL
jgi:hypothetical protein